MQYPKIEQQIIHQSSDMLKEAFSFAGNFQVLVKEDGMVEIRDASGSVMLFMHLKDFHLGIPAACDYLRAGPKGGLNET